MCTASWWYASDGSYEVFFNRDEQKSRAQALPPRSLRREGVDFIAPLDGARGGSWFVANEYGVTVCLLNHYPSEQVPDVGHPVPDASASSRGEIVLRCAAAKDVSQVLEILEEQDLGLFRPFHLLGLGLDGDAKLMTWNGRRLEHSTGGLKAPLSSSSFQTEAVITERHRQYALLASPTVPGHRPPLEIFHDQHDPSRGAFSVLMNRPDAATVSQIHSSVSHRQLHVAYRQLDWAKTRSRWPVDRLSLHLRASLALAS